MRRVVVLHEDCFSSLLSDLKLEELEYMSIVVDKSADQMDTAQLSVFVRYFHEMFSTLLLLCIVALTTNPTGEAIFATVKQFLN